MKTKDLIPLFILLPFILFFTIGLWSFSHTPEELQDIYKIRHVQLRHVQVKHSQPYCQTLSIDKIDSVFSYSVELTNILTKQDTIITIKRNQLYDTKHFVGQYVNILPNGELLKSNL